MNAIDLTAWVGSIAFGISAIPQAWHSWRTGEAASMSWGFLLTWLVGELCYLYYGIATSQLPLVCNYILNLSCLLVIIRYRLYPRELPDDAFSPENVTIERPVRFYIRRSLSTPPDLVYPPEE